MYWTWTTVTRDARGVIDIVVETALVVRVHILDEFDRISLIVLGEECIQILFFQLWVNSRAC